MPNLAHQQSQPQSCAAVCLMVAAAELGRTAAVANVGINLMDAVDVSRFDLKQELNLYKATSNNSFAYSMPSDVGRVAQHLGFDVDVYIYGRVIPPLLKWLYPQELKSCTNRGMNVHEQYPPEPGQKERLLCVVEIGGVFGLHYVLYRPDGSYMDPATGSNYELGFLTGNLGRLGRAMNFLKMGQLCGALKYLDCGIYIKIALPSV